MDDRFRRLRGYRRLIYREERTCHNNGEMELEGLKDETLKLENVLLARDRDAEFDAEAASRQLGTYTDDEML